MEPRKKILLAVIIFVSVSVVLIVVAFLLRVTSPETTPPVTPQTSYVDADSGDVVISTGQTPEKLEDEAIVLGTKKFIDYGMTTYQYDLMMNSLNDYTKTKKVSGDKAITKLSVIVSTIAYRISPDSSQTTIVANIRINTNVTQFMTISYATILGQDLVVNIYSAEGGSLLYTTPPVTQTDSL